ncbi:MAG: hypothetical protein L3J05_06115, partial [Robiginitomaculum sp.]|nr:hypothetical protein [Robiginitomaculum sp.]
MSNTSDQMELKEELIREKYAAAELLLDGFDHTPRLAKKSDTKAKPERSSGIGTRRRFRSTTPGLVTKTTARPEGVHIGNRVATSTEDDPLVSPLQASVLHGLRRALATAMLVSDQYADQTGLTELMKDNLSGSIARGKQAEFSELPAASSLISLHVFANMTSFLLANTYADIADAPKVEAKDIRIALGLLEKTVREQPENTTLRRRLIDMLMSSRIRTLKPALDHISQQLNQTPNDPELEVMRSECLFAANDSKAVDHAYKLIGYDAAKDAFDQEAGVAPEDPPVYRRLANVLRTDQHEQELADRVIDQMVKANNEDGTAYLLRAQYLESIGKKDEALEDVKKA